MPQAQDPTFLNLLDELLESHDGWRSFDAEQVLRFGRIGTPEDETPDHTWTRFDVKGYTRVPNRGEPPRRVEVEHAHISHTETPGDLLADTLEADRARWSKPFSVTTRWVEGARTFLYRLSPLAPLHLPARWSTLAGGLLETQRIRDRVKRREGAAIPLITAEHFYGSVAPGDYISQEHPNAPGGTATAVIMSLKRMFGTETVEVEGWGVESV